MSPNARTLIWLRKLGYLPAVVEQRLPIPGRFVTRDLFGILDIIAIKDGERGCLGVQATTVSNLSARLAKARANEHLRVWKQAGNAFCVVGWAKRGARGKRQTWQPTVRMVEETAQ